MKRLSYIGILILTASVGFSDDNLIVNSGFEAQDFEGWGNWNAFERSRLETNAIVAHEGSQYLNLEIDSKQYYGGFVQNLWQREGVTWGDTIEATAWVRTDSLEGQEAFLLLEFFDEEWVQCGRFESERVSGSTGWLQLKVRGTIPSEIMYPKLDKINVAISLTGNRQAGRALFDYVKARKVRQ